MTVSEQASVLGKQAIILQGGLHLYVRVTDVKESYGTLRYQVVPLAGYGSVWVNADRVSFAKENV